MLIVDSPIFKYPKLAFQNIRILENIISMSSLKTIQAECADYDEWEDGSQPNRPMSGELRSDSSIALSANIIELVSASVGTRLIYSYDPYIRKFNQNDFLTWHSDSEGAHYLGSLNADAMTLYDSKKIISEVINEWSSIFYINDDYEGGELKFGYFSLTIKPKAGTLIFFPAGIEFQHKTMPVLKGTRYTLSAFYTTHKLDTMHRMLRELNMSK